MTADADLRFNDNNWKHDDEVITTYGSIQLSRYQVARASRTAELARILTILEINKIELPAPVMLQLTETEGITYDGRTEIHYDQHN